MTNGQIGQRRTKKTDGWHRSDGWQDGWKSDKSTETNNNLYVKNLPDGCQDDFLWEVFGRLGKVTSVKVLPQTAGKHGATGFVRMATDAEAKHLVDNVNGTMPEGCVENIIIKYKGEESERQAGDWQCPQCPQVNFNRRNECYSCKAKRPEHLYAPGDFQPVQQRDPNEQPHTNLYLRGLPLSFGEDDIRRLFGQYGTVSRVRVLPVASGKSAAAGFVLMEAPGAEWCLANLDGYVPPGSTTEIEVTRADDRQRKAADLGIRPQPY